MQEFFFNSKNIKTNPNKCVVCRSGARDIAVAIQFTI